MPTKIRKHRLLFKNIFPTDEQIIDKMEEEIGAIDKMEWTTELDIMARFGGTDGGMRAVVILVTYAEQG